MTLRIEDMVSKSPQNVPSSPRNGPPCTAVDRMLTCDSSFSTSASIARPGVRVHLGGIGKGYAVERGLEILREAGVTINGLVRYTIGHGLEAASQFLLSHGEAIGIGTIVIALVAGWIFGINPLTVLGLLIIVAGIIVNLQIYFRPTSLYNTLIMLALLAVYLEMSYSKDEILSAAFTSGWSGAIFSCLVDAR